MCTVVTREDAGIITTGADVLSPSDTVSAVSDACSLSLVAE